MCTVVVAAGIVAEHPLVVVANRDEELDRPARPPFLWSQRVPFVAPRDERAGGTWLGLNAHGVFVGITNRFLGLRDASRRSRGELVLRALEHASARDAHAALATLDPTHYNGFHLVYADARDALATIGDGASLAQLTLGRGLHVLTERSFGAADPTPRVRRIEAAWPRLTRAFSAPALTKLLAEHDPADPLGSTCIHLPELRYGTRSAMVLALGRATAKPEMLWAEGPPCTTPFAPVDLDGLGALHGLD